MLNIVWKLPEGVIDKFLKPIKISKNKYICIYAVSCQTNYSNIRYFSSCYIIFKIKLVGSKDLMVYMFPFLFLNNELYFWDVIFCFLHSVDLRRNIY